MNKIIDEHRHEDHSATGVREEDARPGGSVPMSEDEARRVSGGVSRFTERKKSQGGPNLGNR